ncbi:unnamed protein product, partial [Polarella glacialis]
WKVSGIPGTSRRKKVQLEIGGSGALTSNLPRASAAGGFRPACFNETDGWESYGDDLSAKFPSPKEKKWWHVSDEQTSQLVEEQGAARQQRTRPPSSPGISWTACSG